MKQRSKKLLGILLTLALLLSLVPGMSMTAYAAPTETLLTTITATGTEQASYSVANVATVSFSHTAGGSSAYHANWGWWGYGFTATVTPADGYTITKCVFYDDQNRTATDNEAPFVVETTEEDKTPKVNGTPILAYTSKGIKKIEVYGYATPAHTHDFTYSASGATIAAKCTAEGCTLPPSTDGGSDHVAKLTLSAADAAYTGSAYTGASLSDTTAWTGAGLTAPTIEYAGRGTTSYTKSTTAPTAAGTYTASITVDTDKTATADFTISKAAPGTPTVTMSGYTYGNTVSTPSISTNPGNATVTYYYNTTDSTSGGTAWANITATTLDAKTYYMYAVIAESDNYNSYTTSTTSFTVSKADQTAPDAPTKASATTGSITLTEITNGEYKRNNGEWQTSPTFTGLEMNTSYTFYQRLKEDDNHNASPASQSAEISTLNHTHNWSYQAGGDTITATCGNDDGEHGTPLTATLTINAPTLTTYGQTGDGVSAEATITDADGIRGDAAVSYYQATKSGDTYTKTGTALNAAPTNAGDYVAEITLGEGNNAATAAVGYTVAKAAQAAVPSGVTISTIGVESVFFTGVEGEEYIVVPKGTETLDWTAAQTRDEYGTVAFSDGLNEATEYTAYARVAETDNYLPGEAVTQDFATQLSSFGYSGYMIVGGTVQASVDIEVEGIDFRWYRDGAAIEGATADSYTILETDADKAIGVRPFLNGQPLWHEIYACGEAYYGTVNFYREYSENEEELELLHSVDDLKYGDTVQAPDNPTKDGYIFAGWASYFFGESETVTFPMEVEDSLDVYGKWSAIVYDDPTPAETVTIPVSGDENTVSVSVEVKDDTATVQPPTAQQLEQVIGAGVETGDVAIDVSGLGKEIDRVSVPIETLKAITEAVNDPENDANGMTLKLSEGSVTFDGAALAAISEAAKGDDVTLGLDDVGTAGLNEAQKTAVAEIQAEAVYDAYMMSNNTRIHDFKGGAARVSVAHELKTGQSANGIVVWYVAEDGTKTEVKATYENGFVIFAVSHFSNYVIAYDAERAANCPKDETCPLSAFDDADPAAWYHDGVHFVLKNGLMNGLGDGKFDPDGATSRAMIVTILYRLEGKPDVSGKANPFEDVADGEWYTDAVIWAAENKIVEGYAGRFDPTGDVTREQLVTILYRYEQSKGGGFTGAWMFLLDYPDAAEISDWADEAMHWCVMHEIINGKDGKLVPGGSASRAEAATMLMRYLNA